MDETHTEELKQLAENVICDENADTSARLIAMMALDQAKQSLALNSVMAVCMRTEGQVRRLLERQNSIVTELNNTVPSFHMDPFPILEEPESNGASSNGNGNGDGHY